MIDLIDRGKLLEAVKTANAFELYGHRVHEEKDIIEIITKAPCETGLTVQKLCERCVHKNVCHVYLTQGQDKLLRLSTCAFFLEAKHE